MSILSHIISTLRSSFENGTPTPAPSIPNGTHSESPTSAPRAAHTSNETIYVLFNPKARHGRIAHEARSIQDSLRNMGFNVQFEYTAATPEGRAEQVSQVVRRLQNSGANPFRTFVVGGDGTLVPAMHAGAEAVLGRSLNTVGLNESAWANQLIRQMIHEFDPIALGTACDKAKQSGAPPSFAYPLLYGIYEIANNWGVIDFARRQGLEIPIPSALAAMPDFLRNSVAVPETLPILRLEGLADLPCGESAEFGIGAEMFAQGEEARAANPKLRGIQLFVSQLFEIVPRRLRENWSFEAEMTLNGRRLGTVKNLGGILATPNSLQGGIGALPGSYGSVKVLMIPANRRGVLAILEAVGNRLLMNLGIDIISHSKRIRALPQENLLILNPGDRLQMKFRHNGTSEAAGVLVETNGDALRLNNQRHRVEKAEIYVPAVTVDLAASPNSIAARLHSMESLRRGDFIERESNPHCENYRKNLAALPIGRLMSSIATPTSTPTAARSTTTFYPSDSLQRFAENHRIQNAHVSDLIAQAHQNNFDRPLSMAEIEHWGESNVGRAQIESLRSFAGDTRLNRIRSQGGSLIVGLASCLGINRLLSHFGMNEHEHPILHFSLSTLIGHGFHQLTTALSTPVLNQLRGFAYHQASVQTFRTEGLSISRVVYNRAPSLGAALRASLTESFSIGASSARASSLLARGALSLSGIMGRTLLTMGPGLMAGRLVDYTLEHHTSLNASTRSLISSAAFFLPNVASMIFGNPATRILSSPLVMGAGLLFTAGFSADLLYRSYSGSTREAVSTAHQTHSLSQGIAQLLCPEISRRFA